MTTERRTYNKGRDDNSFKKDICEDIIKLFKEKPHFFKDERFRKIALALLADPKDKFLLDIFNQARKDKELEDTLYPNRKFQPAKEDLNWTGEDFIQLFPAEDTDCMIPLPVSRIPNHIAIAGPTGSGKTVCCKNLLKKEAGRITILAFDGSKKQLRHLAKEATLIGKGIVRIWKWDECKIAALQPAWSVSIQNHVSSVIRNIEYSYGLAASGRFAKDNLKKLYAECGIVDGKQGQLYPTLRQWLDFMVSTKPKDDTERRYKGTFSKALSDLADSTAGVFDASYSEFLDELFRKGTINIIEVYGMPFEALSFFITFISDWLFVRRLSDEENIQ